jgi:arginine-glutamic acid dipeptide repeat-containing protein
LIAFQPELVEFYYLWKKTPGANNNRPHRRNRRQQSLRRIRNTRNTRGGQPKEADSSSPAGTSIYSVSLYVSCFAGKGIFPAIEITVGDKNKALCLFAVLERTICAPVHILL